MSSAKTKTPLAAILLLAGLILPVAIFLWLWRHLGSHVAVAAPAGIAMGWVLNVAWALASREHEAQASAEQGDTLSTAIRFGWLCPAVLVLLAWVGLRFLA